MIAILADRVPAFARTLIFYHPTGPLSGVTTVAIVMWLIVWTLLHRRWRTRDLALSRVCLLSFALLILGFLLTFPPVADLL